MNTSKLSRLKRRSEARTAAFRATGTRSRGPTTEEGKPKCAPINVRHTPLAKTALITAESASEFENLLKSHMREFEPRTEHERLLVEKMVDCKWNQMRIRAMIDAGLSAETAAQREKAPEMLDRSLPTSSGGTQQ